MELPRLYLITDRKLFSSQVGLMQKVAELLNAGVRMMQLREKDLTTKELFALAMALREMTRAHDCLLLINDRVDIALACDADGVHLGGHSLPVPTVRALLGPGKVIGVSAHNEDDLAKAARNGADFATFGPVFYTPSKAVYGPPLGLDRLSLACRKRLLPVYALGGVTPDHTTVIKDTGAYGIAAISALLNSRNPADTCQRLKL